MWFNTTTTNGGKLIGFGDGQTSTSNNYDRHVWMQNDGSLVFGTWTGQTNTITSPTGLNDGTWHHVVATQGGDGMKLYVDGALVGSDTTTTTAEPGTSSYMRVAYDNLSNWDATPTSFFFSGTLDDAAYFPSALTATQVQSLYAAAGR